MIRADSDVNGALEYCFMFEAFVRLSLLSIVKDVLQASVVFGTQSAASGCF